MHAVVEMMGLPQLKRWRVLVSSELQRLRDAGRLVYRATDRTWRLRRREERLRIVPELADLRLTAQQLDALCLYMERSLIVVTDALDPLLPHEVASLREVRAVLYAARRPFEAWHADVPPSTRNSKRARGGVAR